MWRRNENVNSFGHCQKKWKEIKKQSSLLISCHSHFLCLFRWYLSWVARMYYVILGNFIAMKNVFFLSLLSFQIFFFFFFGKRMRSGCGSLNILSESRCVILCVFFVVVTMTKFILYAVCKWDALFLGEIFQRVYHQHFLTIFHIIFFGILFFYFLWRWNKCIRCRLKKTP